MSEKFTLTPKGTKLPLLNLKGKDYLMGAYRLVWLNEEFPNFSITTDFLMLTDEQTVAKSTVVLYDKDGKVVKAATATKRETKKDFPDHTEKAESSSIFRALAMLGMGTQHCVVEFDEGNRIVDSPVQTKTTVATNDQAVNIVVQNTPNPTLTVEAPKRSTFKKPQAAKQQTQETTEDVWK